MLISIESFVLTEEDELQTKKEEITMPPFDGPIGLNKTKEVKTKHSEESVIQPNTLETVMKKIDGFKKEHQETERKRIEAEKRAREEEQEKARKERVLETLVKECKSELEIFERAIKNRAYNMKELFMRGYNLNETYWDRLDSKERAVAAAELYNDVVHAGGIFSGRLSARTMCMELKDIFGWIQKSYQVDKDEFFSDESFNEASTRIKTAITDKFRKQAGEEGIKTADFDQVAAQGAYVKYGGGYFPA